MDTPTSIAERIAEAAVHKFADESGINRSRLTDSKEDLTPVDVARATRALGSDAVFGGAVLHNPQLDPINLSGGRLYGVAIGDDTVKVGRSESVTVRLATHFRTAAQRGLEVAGYWVSREVPAHLERYELDLIRSLKGANPGRNRSEYLSGVSLAETAEAAAEVLARTIEEVQSHDARAVGQRFYDLVQASGRTVPEVCKAVGILKVNAYRKIRGGSGFSFIEAVRLTRELGVSLDSLAEVVD
jgi:hypothetical protein